MSSPGQGTDTSGVGAGTLAWEMALAAQSSAYLAEELQIWAEKSAGRTLALHDLTYRRLLGSVVTFRALLDTMHRNLHVINGKAESNDISALSDHMVEEIRSMLAHGLAITTVECMTNIGSQETSNSADAGDTR